MQYGHCVVNATANAINSLYLTGIAPAAMAALSNAQNAFIPSGAVASIFFNWPRFFMSYTAHLLVGRRMLQCATPSGKRGFSPARIPSSRGSGSTLALERILVGMLFSEGVNGHAAGYAEARWALKL